MSKYCIDTYTGKLIFQVPIEPQAQIQKTRKLNATANRDSIAYRIANLSGNNGANFNMSDRSYRRIIYPSSLLENNEETMVNFCEPNTYPDSIDRVQERSRQTIKTSCDCNISCMITINQRISIKDGRISYFELHNRRAKPLQDFDPACRNLKITINISDLELYDDQLDYYEIYQKFQSRETFNKNNNAKGLDLRKPYGHPSWINFLYHNHRYYENVESISSNRYSGYSNVPSRGRTMLSQKKSLRI